jgi:hypothetical protein
MKEIRKFRDMPDWPEVREALRKKSAVIRTWLPSSEKSKGILWTWSKPLWRLKKRLDHA